MRTIARFGMAMALMLVMGGCAKIPQDSGFKEIQTSVSQRAAQDITWRSSDSEDAEARSAVDSLLREELTAEKAIKVAVLNNRELQAIYEELHIAQADLIQAGLLRNPVFSGDIRFGTTGSGTGVDMGLSQDFISIIYVPLRKARAESAFEAAKVRVTSAVIDVIGEVRSAFYEAQAGEQFYEMRQTILEATKVSYELANRLRIAGNTRELDLTNERALYEQSKIDLTDSEARLVIQRENLNGLMGVWGAQTKWKLASRLPPIPSDELPNADFLEKQAVERSLDLQLAQKQVEIAGRDLGIARPMTLLNELSIGIAAEREVNSESKRDNVAILRREIARKLVAGNSAGNALVPLGEPSKGVPPIWSLGPSISLGIPLFDFGQATVGAARARLVQAGERYVALDVTLRARVRANYAAVEAARKKAVNYQSVILPIRQKIIEETQLQYNAMQVSAFQLLQAKRDQISAGAEYVEALREYWIRRTRLDQILSGRMDSWHQESPLSSLADRSSTRQAGELHGN